MAIDIDPQDLSDVIGKIYDSAVDPALWPDALESMCGLIGATLGYIVGGIVVFGDALAAGILLGVQLAAFALVAAAALVTPCGHTRPAVQAA